MHWQCTRQVMYSVYIKWTICKRNIGSSAHRMHRHILICCHSVVNDPTALMTKGAELLHGMSRDHTTFALHVTSFNRLWFEGRWGERDTEGETARLVPQQFFFNRYSAFSPKQRFNCEVSFHSSVTGAERVVGLQKSHPRMDKISLRRGLCGWEELFICSCHLSF